MERAAPQDFQLRRPAGRRANQRPPLTSAIGFYEVSDKVLSVVSPKKRGLVVVQGIEMNAVRQPFIVKRKRRTSSSVCTDHSQIVVHCKQHSRLTLVGRRRGDVPCVGKRLPKQSFFHGTRRYFSCSQRKRVSII